MNIWLQRIIKTIRVLLSASIFLCCALTVILCWAVFGALSEQTMPSLDKILLYILTGCWEYVVLVLVLIAACVAAHPPAKLRYFFVAAFWLFELAMFFGIISLKLFELVCGYLTLSEYPYVVYKAIALFFWSGIGLCLAYLQGRKRCFGLIIHAVISVVIVYFNYHYIWYGW